MSLELAPQVPLLVEEVAQATQFFSRSTNRTACAVPLRQPMHSCLPSFFGLFYRDSDAQLFELGDLRRLRFLTKWIIAEIQL